MKITGFGDFLIHFSPLEYDRFYQSDLMKMSFTGAEANVCCALSFWGEKVNFVTKVPENMLAQKGIMFLNSFRVNTDFIEKGAGRMGTYYLEKGISLRPSAVIYDRDNSAFTNSIFDDYNWEDIFNNTDVFYLSGITPSLSPTLLACCEKALTEARKRNVPVFFDLNLRQKICGIEKSREIFSLLKPYITHLIANEEHLKQLLEINSAEGENPDRLCPFIKTVKDLTGIKNIAVTVRRTISANKAKIYAAYSDDSDFALGPQYEIDVADRVGSGDAFSAGIVYSYAHSFDAKKSVEFASASSALKHTVNNDINFSAIDEIESLIKSNTWDVRR